MKRKLYERLDAAGESLTPQPVPFVRFTVPGCGPGPRSHGPPWQGLGLRPRSPAGLCPVPVPLPVPALLCPAVPVPVPSGTVDACRAAAAAGQGWGGPDLSPQIARGLRPSMCRAGLPVPEGKRACGLLWRFLPLWLRLGCCCGSGCAHGLTGWAVSSYRPGLRARARSPAGQCRDGPRLRSPWGWAGPWARSPVPGWAVPGCASPCQCRDGPGWVDLCPAGLTPPIVRACPAVPMALGCCCGPGCVRAASRLTCARARLRPSPVPADRLGWGGPWAAGPVPVPGCGPGWAGLRSPCPSGQGCSRSPWGWTRSRARPGRCKTVHSVEFIGFSGWTARAVPQPMGCMAGSPPTCGGCLDPSPGQWATKSDCHMPLISLSFPARSPTEFRLQRGLTHTLSRNSSPLSGPVGNKIGTPSGPVEAKIHRPRPGQWATKSKPRPGQWKLKNRA